jgi:hypothetical protein
MARAAKKSAKKSAKPKSTSRKKAAKKPVARPSVKKPATKRPAGKTLDLYAAHRDEYAAPTTPVIVDVGPARYLGITGRGEPGGQAFTEAVGALYNVAFTLKMARKFAGTVYTVSKLEALWWGSGPDDDFMFQPRDQWNWQLLIRTPDFVTTTELGDAISTLVGRGKPARVRDVALVTIEEGSCVQMLHVGPYTEEWRSLESMHALAEREGREVHGRHHEIYLSDPRRVAPAKLRTILRLPVR